MVWIPSGSCELGPVDGFWIDACPVTNGEFAAFAAETGYRTLARREPDLAPWAAYPAGRADHPVTDVAWVDAVAYAAWAGKALPTEAEWVCAAHDAPEAPGAGAGTRPVAAGAPNGYGLYDMFGNVSEWTADWHRASGPLPMKVIRGGAGRLARPYPVHGYGDDLGFRCVVRTG
ncbi:formylglycine-generating enzyme family protein [Rugosimonospora acidiphila]|uniref:Formylglycine-generating enzyme family protein n=1 Tax=Rugosimonospora acidiphila TaxID=556531 RepID=A0ABP9SFW8_9ACTN